MGDFFVLAKQYKATEGGFAARRFSKKIYDPGKNPRKDFFRAGSGNEFFFVLAKKCPFDGLRERFIYVLAKQYRAMDGFFIS